MTAFHGEPVRLRAALVLPASSIMPPPPRRSGVAHVASYEIPGSAANHFMGGGPGATPPNVRRSREVGP